MIYLKNLLFFFSSRRRHTRSLRDWSSDVCSSDLSVNESVERAAYKGIVHGTDRQQRLAVEISGQTEDRQQHEQVVLGDTKFYMLSAWVFLPVNQQCDTEFLEVVFCIQAS